MEAFVRSEITRAPDTFDRSSNYESLKIANDQWRAIGDINHLSALAYKRDAIFYLLYNPWSTALLDPLLKVSSNRLGCRILSQASIQKSYVGVKALPQRFNAELSSINTELAQFISIAIGCKAGIPINAEEPGFDMLLPGTNLAVRALGERPIVDIRKCQSISITVESAMESGRQP